MYAVQGNTIKRLEYTKINDIFPLSAFSTLLPIPAALYRPESWIIPVVLLYFLQAKNYYPTYLWGHLPIVRGRFLGRALAIKKVVFDVETVII